MLDEEERECKRVQTMNKREPIDEEEKEDEEDGDEKKKEGQEEETKETNQQPDVTTTTTTTTPLSIIAPTTPRRFCEWCFKEHTTEHLLLGCTLCNLVVYCDEECQKIHWMRHRPNCVEDYWKANDIEMRVDTRRVRPCIVDGSGGQVSSWCGLFYGG